MLNHALGSRLKHFEAFETDNEAARTPNIGKWDDRMILTPNTYRIAEGASSAWICADHPDFAQALAETDSERP